jgi:xanthosine utilization system XapX-like protein
MLDKIHYLISLFAGAVVIIYSLASGAEPLVAAMRTIAALVVFFLIGIFVRRYLYKLFKKEEPEESSDET